MSLVWNDICTLPKDLNFYKKKMFKKAWKYDVIRVGYNDFASIDIKLNSVVKINKYHSTRFTYAVLLVEM